MGNPIRRPRRGRSGVERAADPDVGAVPGNEQPLLGGPPERGAVRQRRVEVGVPGVQVGVEVHEGHRAVPAMVGPQQRVGDGVVATEGDQLRAGSMRSNACASICHRGGDVERIADDVTRVDHLLMRERRGLQRRVVGPQQARGLADVRRSEPSPGPIGDTGVERDTDDGHVPALHVLVAG